MAGLRGNQAWLMAQKQTAKGTPAVVAAPATGVAGAYKSPFSGGNIGPVRETDIFTETDASRDRGNAYVTTSGVEGTPEIFVRGASFGQVCHAAFGSVARTGTTPNFTHTFTPAATLPYYTFWRSISDTLWERFDDCKVGSLTVSAEAGSPLTASFGVQGIRATRLTADPSLSPAIALQGSGTATLDNTPYTYNDRPAAGIVTLGGGATALVRSFEFTMENNATRQQTDGVVPYDVVEGLREISLGFDLIFESLDEYNKFHYGGAAGTQIASTIFTTSAVFTFEKGTNNSVAFNIPSIAYEEFPVEPDAGGDPIVVSARAVAMRPSSGAIATVTVKNQVDTY